MASFTKMVQGCLKQAYVVSVQGGFLSAARRGLHYDSTTPLRRFYPPRKPPSPYILFYQEQFPAVWDETSQKNITVAAKKIADKWNMASASQKQVFEEKFNELMDEYREQLSKFNSRASDEDKERYKNERAVRKRKKLLSELRKDKKKNVPPRPSAFGLYVSERSRSLFQPFKGTEMFKQLGEEWRKMPDNEKVRFKEEANTKMREYNEKLQTWKVAHNAQLK